MNDLLAPPSPGARRPRNRGGGSDGARNWRGNAPAGRSRGRARGGGSRLASSKPINQADLLSPAITPVSIENGESDLIDTEFDSAEDSDVSREGRFNKAAPGNRYEQVHPPNLTLRSQKMSLRFNS